MISADLGHLLNGSCGGIRGFRMHRLKSSCGDIRQTWGHLLKAHPDDIRGSWGCAFRRVATVTSMRLGVSGGIEG